MFYRFTFHSKQLLQNDDSRTTSPYAPAGIKSAALTMPGSDPPLECPGWLVKWAALTLEYIQLERELLPAALMEKALDGRGPGGEREGL